MRASDADRDRVADRLREALAEGRLSPEEHAERLDALYAAKTYAELVPIVDDLPTAEQPSAPGTPAGQSISVVGGGTVPPPSHQASNIVAIFSGAERKGRWLIEPRTNVLALFGGVELDLRQATLSQREVTLNVTCIFGGIEIKVPPGVRVIYSGASVFGGQQLPGDDPPEPDAPVIRLTGLTLFGGLNVERRAAGEAGSFGRELRERHRELREKRRELREIRRTDRRQRRRGY